MTEFAGFIGKLQGLRAALGLGLVQGTGLYDSRDNSHSSKHCDDSTLHSDHYG